MRSGSLAAILAAAILAAPAGATAQLIDFESEPVGVYAGGTTTIAAGPLSVHFAATGLRIRSGFAVFGGGDRVLSTAGDVQMITGTLLGGATVGSVRIRNPLFPPGETDFITLSIFDAALNSLGQITSSDEFITLTAPGIASFTLDDVNTGYVIDSIEFNVAAVPEPSTVALLAGGLAALAAVARRRRG